MKKFIIFSFILVFGVIFTLQSFTSINNENKIEGKGIDFHEGTYNEILKDAKNSKKIIFVDVYASWCGPCKMLKRNTFANEKVGIFYNENFVNAAFDAEKGEGIELASRYKVGSYPTLLFLNEDGTILKKVVGYHNPEEFLELGQEILKLK